MAIDPQNLIDAAWKARREGRHGDAERDLREAIKIARHKDLRIELIRALKALAHVVRDRDQDERALLLYEEAVALSREQQDHLLLADTVRHLGDVHRDADRLVEAERCYSEALSLYRAASAPPPLDFANAIRPAALLKEAVGDVETAKQLWSEARCFYETAGVRAGVEECERRLSRLDE